MCMVLFSYSMVVIVMNSGVEYDSDIVCVNGRWFSV